MYRELLIKLWPEPVQNNLKGFIFAMSSCFIISLLNIYAAI